MPLITGGHGSQNLAEVKLLEILAGYSGWQAEFSFGAKGGSQLEWPGNGQAIHKNTACRLWGRQWILLWLLLTRRWACK